MESKYLSLIVIAILAAATVIFVAAISNIPQPQQPPVPEVPVEPPIVCGNGTQEVNGTCEAIPIPLPICDEGELFNTTSEMCEKLPVVTPPVQNETEPIDPAVNITEKKIIYVGDIYGAKAKEVGASVVAADPDLVILLGDLCYTDDIDCIKEIYGELKAKGILACLIGNHEKPIMKLALDYCGADFFIKHFQGTVILGLNTEGDLVKQLSDLKARFADPEFKEGVENVIITSHKPCKNLPGAHHPANEDGNKIPNFCADVRKLIPQGIQVYFVAGHDHNLAQGIDTNGDVYHISGGGGRGLYPCGDVTGIWDFCMKQHGFLQYIVEPDGDITYNFMNSKGVAFN